jgi:NADH:ubiquinone oxidoreductase subunit F (NADH-binding)
MLTDLLASGGGPADVSADVRELVDVMRRTSICGLGQVALGPVASVIKLSARPGEHGDSANGGRHEG